MSHHTPRARKKLQKKYKDKSTHWLSKKINPRIQYKPKSGFGLFSKSCGVDGCRINIGRGNNPITFKIPGSKKKIEKILSEQQEETGAVSTIEDIESSALYKQENVDAVTGIMSGEGVIKESLTKPIEYPEDNCNYVKGEGIICEGSTEDITKSDVSKDEEVSERHIKADM